MARKIRVLLLNLGQWQSHTIGAIHSSIPRANFRSRFSVRVITSPVIFFLFPFVRGVEFSIEPANSLHSSSLPAFDFSLYTDNLHWTARVSVVISGLDYLGKLRDPDIVSD
jgi:hypothetical protein